MTLAWQLAPAILALVSALLQGPVVVQGPASRPAVIDAGALRLEVHLSRTANVFHVVDQISAWSPYCHAQYRRAFAAGKDALSDADLAQLEVHKAVRAQRGWGAGLEQAFYTPLELDAALREAVARGHLTEKEAEDERSVLQHFAPRVAGLLEQELARLEAFRDRLVASRETLRAFAAKVSRFCGGAKVTVPVYLIANPADRDFGGGYNGDRLTLEVPRAYDALPTFLHEAMHAFVATQHDKLRAALAKEPSLDFETLNEGIAYALAPGIHHPESESDTLGAAVAQDVGRGASLDDGLVRFRRFGLALRPLLREALAGDQDLGAFLPRALDAWRVMKELTGAQVEKEAGWFSAGPAYKTLGEVAAQRGGRLVHSANHSKENYRMLLDRAAPGSRLVLLLALDHADRRVAPGFEDLFPKPLAEIEAALQRGETVELRGRARGVETVVLAAPTVERLELLIRATRFLER